MGESKRKTEPRGFGMEFKRVELMLPATFHYNPRTEEVYYPRVNKSAMLVTDETVIKMVKEKYQEMNSRIIKP